MAFRDHLLFWPGLAIAPLLVAEAAWARRNTPRLNVARPPDYGSSGDDRNTGADVVSIVLLGESTAAGVGAATHDRALAGWLARGLSEQLLRPIRHRSLGLVGARAIDCLEQTLPFELLPLLKREPATVVVLMLGANDTTKLTPRKRWRAELHRLVDELRGGTSGPIVLTGVPPMAHFTALPQPLRAVVGARARMLDDDIALVASERQQTYHHAPRVPMKREFLASDGFHPSERGYEVWAEQLTELIASVLT